PIALTYKCWIRLTFPIHLIRNILTSHPHKWYSYPTMEPKMKITFATAALACSVALPSFAGEAEVVTTYIDIAHATYEDSLTKAMELQSAVDALIAEPSEDALNAARDAWIAARVPYMQTEAYRFGNPIVDDWEGKVNAWPLDEGLIDYVDASYGG